ncbi:MULTISPECIES: DUF975 family protein [unclassified Mesobacillus]|jgi:uncharacterized membrane protein|uniref:DUF975 family protein n=1 Tax=unclassified Mesobacillus TaxID=2675270 RepID=UPI00203EC33C|nr:MULTISPECIES: DUF975 family protein [unclassified Mesobacillus]MCM3124784.1 DUF975 family protein [Mesobacillus sp. MER 33]MCM3232907.1 DUF975 family protein [Mesobacillus sp. MER 48]
MNLSISQIKKKALASLKGKWGIGVALTFLIFLITTIVPGIIEVVLSGGFSEWANQDETPLIADMVNLLISFLFIPLTVASYWFFLVIARWNDPKISDIFAVYKKWELSLKLIGTSILVGIFTILWSLLLIIPGIIKGISYSQVFFLLRDNPQLSALEAITESKIRMKGYKWKYFLLNLSFIGWAFIAIFTFGIGFLWLAPYISTANATFYNELIAPKGHEDAESSDLAI